MLRLLFQYYHDRSGAVRQAELDHCLQANLNNPLVDECLVIAEPALPMPDSPRLVRIAPTELSGLPHASGRPSFAQLLSLAGSRAEPDDISVICNSDVCFDDTLALVKDMGPDQFFCMGRWNVMPNGQQELWAVNCGQDAWIFRGPPRKMWAEFPPGYPGCDNRLCHEARNAGYDVRNPALEIRVIHYHASAVRHWPATEARVSNCSGRVPHPYLFLAPGTRTSPPDFSTRATEVVDRTLIKEQVRPLLDNVTLLCADCVDPDLAVQALCYSQRGLRFGAVKLLSHVAPANLEGVTFCEIPRLETVAAYNEFILRQLHQYVTTPFCLSIHTDGFLLHPECWDPVFLQYDYVGAPWPANAKHDWAAPHYMGNSGFCLRSLRLLQTTPQLPEELYAAHRARWPSMIDDIFTCVIAREALEAQGMRFAPQDLAWRFSREQALGSEPLDLAGSLGFHGVLTDATRAAVAELRGRDDSSPFPEARFPPTDPIFYYPTMRAGAVQARSLRAGLIGVHDARGQGARSLEDLARLGRCFRSAALTSVSAGARLHLASWINQYGPFDVIVLADLCVWGWSHDGLRHTLGLWGDFDAMFGNGQRGKNPAYCDMATFQALRQLRRAPNTPQLRRGDALYPVSSAFGGLAVYAAPAFFSVPFDGSILNFHGAMRRAGHARMFINPSMLVRYDDPGHGR